MHKPVLAGCPPATVFITTTLEIGVNIPKSTNTQAGGLGLVIEVMQPEPVPLLMQFAATVVLLIVVDRYAALGDM